VQDTLWFLTSAWGDGQSTRRKAYSTCSLEGGAMEKPYMNMSETDHGKRGYLIVLEGIDGSGKTTLSQHVTAGLRDLKVSYCSNKEIARDKTFIERSMLSVAAMLWPKENTSFDHLLPPYYWLHLQATWYSLLSEFVILPKLKDEQVLIIDGWYYKFMAKLLLRGFKLNYLDVIFSHVVQPDIVILLESDVEAIWDRKSDFRWHELGLHHDYPELGKSSFIDYQSKILGWLKILAQEKNWITVDVDADASIDQNSKIIQSHIRKLLFFSSNSTVTD
jgi:thymidylate kinase